MLIKVNKNYFYTKDAVTIAYVKEWSKKTAQIRKDNQKLYDGGYKEMAEVCEMILNETLETIIEALKDNERVMPLPIIINK